MIQIQRAVVIAGRYLIGHIKRYLFLIIAIGFGYSIIITMSSLSNGMLEKVSSAARFHYGGDIFISALPSNPGGIGRMDDSMIDIGNLSMVLPMGTRMIPRTNLFKNGIIYFEGSLSRQKNVFGIDWEKEKPELEKLNLIEGSLNSLGDDTILISEPVAQHLKVGVDDRVTLQLLTLSGQINTRSLAVIGIYSERNIFGFYRSYMDRRVLNQMIGFKDDEYSSLGIYLENPQKLILKGIHSFLLDKDSETIIVRKKEEYNRARSGNWKGYRLFIIPLGVYISEVDDLVQAMRIGSYVVFVMIAMIVMVSVMVTYNLIVNERLKEIGTLRSIGLQKRDVTILFFFEGLYLLSISVALGALLSLILNLGISRISFDWIPGFSLFLENGRLHGKYTRGTFIWNALLLALILAPAQAIPVVKALQRSIVECL